MKQIAENQWYFSMLFGVYAGKILQYDTWYHIPRSVNKTKLPFLWGATSNDFVFWSEECVSLVDEIGFEELILNMNISMLNCQTKKWLMCLSKVSCIWRPSMGRLPHPGGEKSSLLKLSALYSLKKKQDAVASTSPLECDGTSFELFCHARSQTDQKWPQILVIVACDRLFPHQDRDSYHSREECFANIKLG